MEGYCEITKVIISDENGKEKQKEQYFNLTEFFNNFVTHRYTIIIQVNPVKEKKVHD